MAMMMGTTTTTNYDGGSDGETLSKCLINVIIIIITMRINCPHILLQGHHRAVKEPNETCRIELPPLLVKVEAVELLAPQLAHVGPRRLHPLVEDILQVL